VVHQKKEKKRHRPPATANRRWEAGVTVRGDGSYETSSLGRQRNVFIFCVSAKARWVQAAAVCSASQRQNYFAVGVVQKSKDVLKEIGGCLQS
jgi:hypothetical protein